METSTLALVVAFGAIALAILMAIMKKAKGPVENTQDSAVLAPKAVKPPPTPRRRQNKHGWRAPSGYYFNDDDELVTDVGDIIMDMMTIALLCGEQYDSEEAPVIEEAVGSETIASRPNELEAAASATASASASTSFSDTDRHSSPEPSYSGGDSCDSGGDSGGDCGGD